MQKRLVNYLFFSFVAVLLLVSVVSAVWWSPSTWFEGRGITGNVVSATDYTNGLVAYWKFDESSYSGGVGQVKDELGVSHGTPVSSPLIVSPGLKGNAVRFTGVGSQTINIATPLSTNKFNLKNFTLSAWVKTSDAGSGRRRVFSQQPGSYYGMALNGNNLECFSSFDLGVVQFNSLANKPLNNNQWHHVSCVRNAGSEFVFYIDGERVQRNPISSSVSASASYNSNANIRIGNYGGFSEVFNGLIDEVRVYNTALSDNQIRQVYDFSKPVSDAPICNSFTYTLGACQPSNQLNSQQTTTVATQSPTGCVGGTPTLTQPCIYFPPVKNVQLGELANQSNFIQINSTNRLRVIGIYNSSSSNFNDDQINFRLYNNDNTELNLFYTGTQTAEGRGILTLFGNIYNYSYRASANSAPYDRQVNLTLTPPVKTVQIGEWANVGDSIQLTSDTLAKVNGIVNNAGSFASDEVVFHQTTSGGPITGKVYKAISEGVCSSTSNPNALPYFAGGLNGKFYNVEYRGVTGSTTNPPQARLVAISCVAADWTSTDSACASNSKKTRTWTKANVFCDKDLAGSVTHLNTEEVTCIYVAPVKTVQIGEWANVGDKIQLDSSTVVEVMNIANSAGFANDLVMFNQYPISGQGAGIFNNFKGASEGKAEGWYFKTKYYTIEYRGVTGSSSSPLQTRLVPVLCTDADWRFTLSSCGADSKQTKNWEKKNSYCDESLAGSVNHLASETGVPCTYSNYHPADTNKDFRITVQEVTAYGNGQHAVSASSIWTAGESYVWNAASQNWFSTFVSPAICGNNICEAGESSLNCPIDCPTTSTVPTTCVDSDSSTTYPTGLNYGVKGTFDAPAEHTSWTAEQRTDYCVTGTNKLREYSCDSIPAGYDYNGQEVDCPTGTTCQYGACVGAQPTAVAAISGTCGNRIVETGEGCDNGPLNGQVCTIVGNSGSCTYCRSNCQTEVNSQSGSGGSGSCPSGCSLESGQCVPLGYRTGGKYCAVDKSMTSQKTTVNADCENNFECGSNLCVSGKCVEAGFFQSISDFFSKLFAKS